MAQPFPAGPPVALPVAPPVNQTLHCNRCGCLPAAAVNFRGHRGMVFLMRFLQENGPFCRDCGLATFRRMTADTLLLGWWGYGSAIITPITVLINLTRRGAVANLPAPRPPASGRYGSPAIPGPPLLARPQAIVGLSIPVLVLFFIVVLAVSSS